MRGADLATFIRVGIILLVAYLVLVGFNPLVSVLLFAVALVLDGADGYMAVLEASGGKLTLGKYLRGSDGDAKIKGAIKEAKLKAAKAAPYGPRLDVIGDRIIEYIFWMLFTYIHVVPLFVFMIVIIRNCAADGLMGLKGTSSKMKTAFAQDHVCICTEQGSSEHTEVPNLRLPDTPVRGRIPGNNRAGAGGHTSDIHGRERSIRDLRSP